MASNHSSDIDSKDSVKLFKDYAKGEFSFLVNDTTLPSIIYEDLGRAYYKMTVPEKIKTIDQKIE